MMNFSKHPLHDASLTLAIALTLLIKSLLLFGIWKASFSAPQTSQMQLPVAQVESHMVESPSPATIRMQR